MSEDARDPLQKWLEEEQPVDDEVLLEPASEAEVDAAEARLGYKLPPSYRKIVTSPPARDSEFLYRLAAGYHRPKLDSLNQPWLIAICGPGDGDEYCFDARHPDADGEYPIVLYNHETDDEETTEYKLISPNLIAFLASIKGTATIDGAAAGVEAG